MAGGDHGRKARRVSNARGAAFAFAASIVASLGLATVYIRGGQAQLEGALLATVLGGICIGLILWAKHLMPSGPTTQRRAVTLAETADLEEAEDSFEEGAELIGRRRFLGRMLAGAIGAFGVAALFPVRSLGGRPDGVLGHTAWRSGLRAVTDTGQPVRPSDVAVNGVITVFPETAVGNAEAQTLLIHLPDGDYRPLPGREDWAPGNVVGFSKVCTHAGCPVGLYRSDSMELYCPCHQSVFEVLKAARPSEGPATRALPQLPLTLDTDGYLIAQGDFPEPIGPGYWNRDRRG